MVGRGKKCAKESVCECVRGYVGVGIHQMCVRTRIDMHIHYTCSAFVLCMCEGVLLCLACDLCVF